MSNEEKQAIEKIKKDLEEEKKLRGDYKWKTGFYENGYIERVLNLVEKQQKEKEKNKDAIDNNYISKDKIKAKIEECENKIKKIRSKKLINEPEDTIVITRYAHYISVLQSLLEKE